MSKTSASAWREPSSTKIRWPKAFRIIRSVYPPIDLFEDIADPADWELIAAGEAKTNPRVRDRIGKIHLVPPERRVSGPGASWVMAAFTHVSPARCTRFGDGTFGVYYCGDRFEVALCETVHHFERMMRATQEPPITADFRELVGTVAARVHDLRDRERYAACLDPDDYATAQSLAKRLRDEAHSNGIVYRSVRHPPGQALAAFWPDVVGIPKQGRHLAYRWNGERCDRYFVYGREQWRPVPRA